VCANGVGPRYFSTLGIPIVRGREIAEQDARGATGAARLSRVPLPPQRPPRPLRGSVRTNARLERRAVPAAEVGPGLIGRLEELLDGRVRIGRAADLVIRQEELAER